MSDEYVKSEEIIETRWTCPTCEKENRGRDMKCPNCGAPKDESSEYQVDASAAAIGDAEQVADAEAGEHWTCAFCEKENRGRKKLCQFCGADQTTKDRKQAKPAAAAPATKPRSRRGCLVAVGVLVVLLGLLAWLGSPRHVKATVAGLEWEQAVHLQKRTVVHKDGWRDQVPSDAADTSCERRQRTTRQVVDHYRSVTKTRSVRYQSGSHEVCHTQTENMKNGYAKRREVCHSEPDYSSRNETYTDQDPVYRTEPVFDDFCRFDVFEWPVMQTVSRKGTGPTGLAWPEDGEAIAGQTTGACVPCAEAKARREVQFCCARDAHYRVHFENPKKPEEKPTYEAKTPEEFATFAVGQSHELSIQGDKVELQKAAE